MEDPEGIAGSVELITGVVGEVEAKILVVVQHRRVDRAVQQREHGVRRRRYYCRLDVRQDKIMVRLKNGARRHGRVVYDHLLLVVVDRLHLVVTRWGDEKQVRGIAVQHAAELRRPAPVVHAKRVFYGDGAARGAAWGEGDGGGDNGRREGLEGN